MNKKRKILFVVNVDWIFISHRLPIAEAALKAGYAVIVAAKDSGRANEIRERGIEFIDIPISRSGTNPLIELQLLYVFFKLYLKIRPTIIHQITMKPVIYGSIAAKVLGLQTVNAISGLGYSFTEKRMGWVQRLMVVCMKYGFSKKNNHLIFQNKDDFNELKQLKIINENTVVSFIKGVGVHLDEYAFVKQKNSILKIVFPARMLWDKGVEEFIDAAILLKEKYPEKVFFQLYGKIDLENKMGVPISYLKEHASHTYLKWFGHRENMVSLFQKTDIVVLPSYREGLPKVLIEACAAGIPIVTTHAIGCRDCVDEGKNGYKIPVKSVALLVDAIEKLILSSELRNEMGRNSRKKAIKEFDQKDVIDKHLKIYKSFL
jgi:glycosyltransferase involved in cell wall biosynthesis